MRAFNRIFVRLPQTRLYAILFAVSAAVAAWLASDVTSIVVPVVIVLLGYPSFEYLLHRYLLHNTHLCRTPMTARVWWRIHYRHHAQPSDAKVILGAPWTLLFAVTVGTLLSASVYWSLAGLAAAAAASLFCVMVYEYLHSFEHSRVESRNRYLTAMRRHHLTHHYINEQGNYGIAFSWVDRLCGTVVSGDRDARSPTVHNLGYQGAMKERYPFIDRIERTMHADGKASQHRFG
jgi:sterol desaturase/sphingolipid hydroxylase (fatty acid hydroxylase superfamily)